MGMNKTKTDKNQKTKLACQWKLKKTFFFLVVWDGDDVTPGQIAGT